MMPTPILEFEDDSEDNMPMNKATVKTPETINIKDLSEIVVKTSKIYEDKYLSYFVTQKN